MRTASRAKTLLAFTTFFASLGLAATASAMTREVGPGKPYATPCAAIAAASAGDTIQVDAAGSYDGDTCAWTTDNLTVIGINGRPKIDLTGVTPNQSKGIFNISADHATLDNFELSGAAIDGGSGPGDSNGAGIRHQGLFLTVKNCYIHNNQDGILGAPITANTGAVIISNTEFSDNGEGDGYTHNMYLGDYTTVTVEYSYSHHSNVGHLLKSRAFTSFILYNRLTDETGGNGSYELDLPNAGTAFVIGNVIEQSATSMNPGIVTYGEEGVPTGYDSHLYFVNNSVVNDLMSGTFVINASTTPAILTNNIFYEPGTLNSNAADVLTTNFSTGDPMFSDLALLDLRLTSGSPCIDMGTDPGKAGSQSLEPVFEYVQSESSMARTVVGKAIDIGAYEFGLTDGGTPPAGDSGMPMKDASTGTPDSGKKPHIDAGSPSGEDASSIPPGAGPTSTSSGCGCFAAGTPPTDGLLALGLEAVIALFAVRRRTRRS
jgi:hypothetical protein